MFNLLFSYYNLETWNILKEGKNMNEVLAII